LAKGADCADKDIALGWNLWGFEEKVGECYVLLWSEKVGTLIGDRMSKSIGYVQRIRARGTRRGILNRGRSFLHFLCYFHDQAWDIDIVMRCVFCLFECNLPAI
jgi:hypothetical protein